MTKLEQIEILSRISDTASMTINDQNDLREVIKEMKSEPNPQFVTAYTLDELISSSGGAWKLCYVYDRFGYSTLMLLPTDERFCSIDDASEILLDMNEGDFEHSLIIDHYIRSCPNNPFIIRENGFIECIKELHSRLFQLMDEDGYIGKSTKNEILYAINTKKFGELPSSAEKGDVKNSKPVVFMEPVQLKQWDDILSSMYVDSLIQCISPTLQYMIEDLMRSIINYEFLY